MYKFYFNCFPRFIVFLSTALSNLSLTSVFYEMSFVDASHSDSSATLSNVLLE